MGASRGGPCDSTALVHFSKNCTRFSNAHIDILFYSSMFLARDSIYAIARYMPSPVRLAVRLSVCLSVHHTGGSDG